MKHTSGAWHTGHIGDGEYRREVVFDNNCGQVAMVTMPGPQGEAEARLIAAAPDLLAVLKEAHSLLSSLDSPLMQKMKAVIAKAEAS